MAAGSNNIVTDGLRGCWDAGNRRSYPGAGTTWTDPVGGIKGTLINEDDDALSFNSSKGGYFEFDGTDGRVDCGDNLIVGWTEISVCVWAWMEPNQNCPKLVSIGHAGAFDMAACLNDDHSAADGNWFFCYINGDYLATPAGSIIPYLGKWTHWVVTRNSGYTTRLYIDGELKAEASRGGTIGAASYDMCFGNAGDRSRPLEGNMASVYIYDRVLSDDEIKQNYEATKSRFTPRITKSGLVGNWDAGDPQSYNGGTTWKDIANTNDATLTNDIVFNSSDGGSLVFDGTDSKATTTFTDQLGDFTVCAWFSQDALTLHARLVDKNYQTGFWLGYSGSNNEWGGGIRETSSPYGIYVQLTEDWNFIAMTRSGSTQTVYGNGTSTTATQSCSSTALDTEPLRIGISADQHTGSGGAHYFEGKIALVRLYNRGLSAAEILDNYNKTKGRFGH